MAKLKLFILATFLALSASGQPTKPACSAPQPYFTVNEFTTFTPSTGKIEPGKVSFYIGNTSCSSTTVLNTGVPHTCTDANYDYLWDGKSLTVREIFTPCANV